MNSSNIESRCIVSRIESCNQTQNQFLTTHSKPKKCIFPEQCWCIPRLMSRKICCCIDGGCVVVVRYQSVLISI